MANHKSALKRIRRNNAKRIHNKIQFKTVRNAIRDLRAEVDKSKAEENFPKLTGMIDKLVKNNLIHKNKASNLKSKLAKKIAAL